MLVCKYNLLLQKNKTLMQLAMEEAERDNSVMDCCRVIHDYRSTSVGILVL